jgi:4-amino-4-deoxy-L-arabinose transferase-like glycosyltransferase
MDVDASQYAEISREMARSNDFLHIYDRGFDYLDKPPLLFWLCAFSMKLFGATLFAYRLPSILFAFLAIYATYRLTRLLYNESTARIAALVLATCQGFFLWTNDVRTDMILTGCIAAALWCIRECEQRRRWYYVLGGTAAIACGMMTKGPIALFVPLFAFGADWVLRRKWKQLFNPWHLADALLIALFLIPMCIGLYQQFDIHPEKWVDHKQGISGLRFFFWTQSFGRITGENAWSNDADPFFLLSNMGWAFLPWILLFGTALIRNIWQLIAQRLHLPEGQEWLSTGGFVLTYLSLCLSRYQLPHYILVAFPLAAIMVGKLLYDFIATDRCNKLRKTFTWIQTGISAMLFVGVLLIITLVFPAGITGISLWLVSVAIWLYILLRNKAGKRMLWASASAIIAVNFFLTNFFYYPLLQYQCGSVMGKYVRTHRIPQERLWIWRMDDPMDAIHFYSRMVIRQWDDFPAPGEPGDYLITMRRNLPSLDSAGRPYTIIKEGRLFKVSEITPEFLNIKTRDSATKPYCLILLR